MENKEHLADLLKLYLQRKIDAENQHELMSAIALNDHKQWDEILEQVKPDWIEQKNMDDPKQEKILREILLAGEFYHEKSLPVSQHILHPRLWWAAAVILLLIGAGAYFWMIKNTHEQPIAVVNKSLQTDIQPGTNKAILTLADGKTIVLDSVTNGTIAQQGNTSVIKLTDGSIQYNVEELVKGGALINKMSTPKGGQYQLTLSDGTRAWLNAASYIKYPVVFSGTERRVEVNGEVYFEIAKDVSMPFKVSAAGQEIEVLGTAFNVYAYNDEPFKTSLAEGAIKINQQILKPDQAYFNGQIITTNVEADLAWKNGYFNLQNIHLQDLMKQIARWYDIEVVYEKGIPGITLGGKINRNLTLAQLLEGLGKMDVKFKMEGRKLIILP